MRSSSRGLEVSSRGGGIMVVLQVEDCRQDRELLAAAVACTDAGVTLRSVPDGREAIDYLEGTGDYGHRSEFPLPDVILLDMEMPRMNGEEFLKWRQDSRFALIPVVVLSGGIQTAARERALSMGALMAFAKPDTFQGLAALVRNVAAGVRKHAL